MAVIKHCGLINDVYEWGFAAVAISKRCATTHYFVPRPDKMCHNMFGIFVLRHAVCFIQRQPGVRSEIFVAQVEYSGLAGSNSESSFRTRELCNERWSNGYGILVAL